MRDKTRGIHTTTASCLKFNKIISQRTRGDRTYYKVQWKGQQLHTWELEENLDAETVAEFKRKNASAEQPPPEEHEKPKLGFQRGLEPERIVGMYEVGANKAIMFKIKWKGSKVQDLVTVEEAKEKCPQLVIEFYEQRISWIQ